MRRVSVDDGSHGRVKAIYGSVHRELGGRAASGKTALPRYVYQVASPYIPQAAPGRRNEKPVARSRAQVARGPTHKSSPGHVPGPPGQFSVIILVHVHTPQEKANPVPMDYPSGTGGSRGATLVGQNMPGPLC